jgi:DNA mismatch repair protein MutH
MDRLEAIARIQELVGTDLRPMADQFEVTVWKGGEPNIMRNNKNKGWAGHVIERYLGLPLNSSRAPNFGSWELKVIPLKRRRNGALCVKETMAITMLDPVEVLQKDFEESHLFTKLRKTVIVARVFENVLETSSLLYGINDFDLNESDVYRQIKADYDTIRDVIRAQGFSALSGRQGVLIQPRTKGPGHGSISRAFYARTKFLSILFDLA